MESLGSLEVNCETAEGLDHLITRSMPHGKFGCPVTQHRQTLFSRGKRKTAMTVAAHQGIVSSLTE